MKENIKVVVSNIQWDTDDLSGLPKTVEVEVPADEFYEDNVKMSDEEIEDEDILGEYASNYISDEYGFCHNGFDLEIVA